MTASSRVFALFAGAVLCVSCGGGGGQSAGGGGAASGAASATAKASEVGIPECDQFLNKYYACVDSKVPDSVKPTLKQSIEQTKAAWKQAAATPQGKAGLKQACVQMEAQTKASLTAYKCAW
jgi:hypothetical protein